jgi:hypothetical protein
MDGVIEMQVVQESRGAGSYSSHAAPVRLEAASREAHRILHVGFTVAPIVAGVDKFTHILVNWDQYLAPWIANLSPIGGHNLMLVVGILEVIAGIVVAMRPRFGGYLVAAWLGGIILNLLTVPGYFDVALRDFGLLLGALALARLAAAFDRS